MNKPEKCDQLINSDECNWITSHPRGLLPTKVTHVELTAKGPAQIACIDGKKHIKGFKNQDLSNLDIEVFAICNAACSIQ